MNSSASIILTIPNNMGGQRLDVALQKLLPEHSRSRIQSWIRDGFVKIGEAELTPKQKVWGGEQLLINVPASPEEQAFSPEPMPLDIVYEDDHIMVINKPAGQVVHPAAGNWSGTLLNGLLHHAPQVAEIPRAGIVHRLDKDTTGLLVTAKTLQAQTHLVRQLQARTVKREYRAIVWGQIWKNGTVNQPIGRDPHSRKRMAVNRLGKPAVTHYEVLERFSVNTYLRCMLETGRTHQIRVHMRHLKAPLVGDPVYGLQGIFPRQHMDDHLIATVTDFKRQALHATRLGLLHPATEKPMEWHAELPDDMKALLEAMRTTPPQSHATFTPTWVEGEPIEYDESDEDWDDTLDEESDDVE